MTSETTSSVRYDIDFGSIPVSPPSAPRTDLRAPMYAAIDGRVASLSNNECVFQPRDGDELHVMTHQVLQALDQCREFRSLDEHVARVASVIPGLAGQGEAVRRVLTGLIDRGLLRSDGDFLAALRRDDGPAPAPMKTLVVRACDRPEQLKQLLHSLAEHGERFGRRDNVMLIDDSNSGEAAREHARALQVYATASGGVGRYIGSEQARSIVERLTKARPEVKEVLAALLLPRTGNGFGGGRGYNLALLLTAGERLGLIDDDYRLPFHRAHGVRDGLDPDPALRFGVRFHADRDRALGDGEALDVDGLAMQEALVGHALGHALAQPAFAIDRERLRGQALARLSHLRSDARILATYTGSRGASFTSDSAWLYDIDPSSRAGFWLDRDSYLRNVHAETIVHAPECVLARPFGLFTPFLLDNAQLLPCTAPTGRGEDGLFGVVGSYLYPDSQTLHLPITIGHVQEGRRPRYERAMQPLTPGINRFLREWVRNNAQPAQSAEPGDRLALLAAQLDDLANAPAQTQVGILTEYLRYVRADLIERLQQQIGSATDAPVYWTADARRIVEENGKALLSNGVPRLDEWPETIDAPGCAERLRSACLDMAAAYRQWPALWQTAAELGDRLLPG